MKMTSTHKDNAKTDDVAPAVPMSSAAAFALADDDEESNKIAAAFRKAIEPRPLIAGP